MLPTRASTTAVVSRRCGWTGRRTCISQGGGLMEKQYPTRRTVLCVSRRDLLKAGLAAGATLSAWPLHRPPALWGAEAGQPRRGGILRVRGFDPPHFDPHLIIAGFTQSTVGFVYSKLVRHKVGG